MEIPLYEFPTCIDFNDFMDALGEKYGWNYRDMAGKYTTEGREKTKALKAQWLKENGYEGKEHVLDVPVGSKIDWPVGSEEMNLRIEINQKFNRIEKAYEVPYQDVWHWLMDNAFYDISNGSMQYLAVDLIDEDTPDYVQTVLNAIYETVPEDHPARKYGSINFYVHW